MADRALVTGATGFIGTHLARTLLKSGVQVACLVRRSSDLRYLQALEVQLIFADLDEPGSLDGSLPEAQCVYHLAGLTKSFSESELLRINEGGTRNLLHAISSWKNPPNVVVVSSLAAAGPSLDSHPHQEIAEPRPISSYGRSKLAAEWATVEFADRLPLSIVRPPMVFGEGDTDVFEMFRMASRGFFLLPVPASRRYSLIHALDLSEFLLLVATRGERIPSNTGRTDYGTGRYYVGYDFHPTYEELGHRMAESMGRKRLLVLRTPYFLAYTVAAISELSARLRGRPPGIVNLDKAQEGRAGSWHCSSRKAQEQLGFKPHEDLNKRMKQTAEWYTKEGWL